VPSGITSYCFPPFAGALAAAAFGSAFFPLASLGSTSSFLGPRALSSASFLRSSLILAFSSSLLKSQIAYLNSNSPSFLTSNYLVVLSPYCIGPKFKFLRGAILYLLKTAFTLTNIGML